MRVKKVAVVQPTFNVGGGNEAVASWMLESLKTSYDLSLISFSEVEPEAINRYYGTNLEVADFSVIHPKLPSVLIGTRKFSLLKDHLLMRFCKSVRDEYDLFISSSGGMDFGTPGMQYFCYAPASRLYTGSLGWRNLAKSVVETASRRISNYSLSNVQQNVSIVLSDWSGQVTSDAYDLDRFDVIYPPVNAPFSKTSWNEKQDSFLCIARIVPEKHIDMVIDILKQVRSRGNDVSLHVVGRSDDVDYCRLIEGLCEENQSWATFHGLQDRQELARLMDECRYGINGLTEEPFGIAIAEMVKSGCIVFVPNGGGQTEIVGAQELTFNDTGDAVDKICAVLNDDGFQAKLLEHLDGQGQLFSTQEFSRRMQNIVSDFFQTDSSTKVLHAPRAPLS